jgi:hypothetical protein
MKRFDKIEAVFLMVLVGEMTTISFATLVEAVHENVQKTPDNFR